MKFNQFTLLEFAFKHHNHEIFNDSLGYHLFSVNRKEILGFFFAEELTSEHWKDKSFHIKLMHYMLHLVQEKERTASPRGYHNKRFAVLSDKIDLPASATGLPGGRNTGQYMSHYCIPCGIADKSIEKFVTDDIEFEAIPIIDSIPNNGKSSWIMYQCPCGSKAKAKPYELNVCFRSWELFFPQGLDKKEENLKNFIDEEIVKTTLKLLKKLKDQIYDKLFVELQPLLQENNKTDKKTKCLVMQKIKNLTKTWNIHGNFSIGECL